MQCCTSKTPQISFHAGKLKRQEGDSLKLSYFDLLSPDPVYIQDAGGIISPTLKDISSIGIQTYQYYLGILSMTVQSFFDMSGMKEEYEMLPEDEKSKINIFELLTGDKRTVSLLEKIFNFFMAETAVYSPADNCFIIKKDKDIIGTINRQNYNSICNVIFQRNYIKYQSEDVSEIKNKKAAEIMKKIQRGRKNKRQSAPDKNFELGNIISAVACKSNSLNIINIWNLTVFQVWDCFARLSNNTIYNIQSMSVAAWGDKDNHFDAGAWFKTIDNDK